MAAPKTKQSTAPYAANSKDTVTANTGNVEVNVSIRLVGTVSQVQADWATLAATSLTSPTATISHNSGKAC